MLYVYKDVLKFILTLLTLFLNYQNNAFKSNNVVAYKEKNK